MDLVNNSQPARNARTGREVIEIPAGQRLTIETSPGGVEVIDEVVPEGQTWTVTFDIDILIS